MSKNSILPEKSGNPDHQNVLTDKPYLAYFIKAVAKNSGQNSHSEIPKMHSRILRGFFYARKMCNTMTDCVGESLVSALGSPFSLGSGNANPARSVTLLFAWKLTVSNLPKETV